MSKSATEDVSTAVGPTRRVEPPDVVLALTIASHPTGHRVGERFLLEAVATGREVSLSRNDPDFTRPGRALGAPLGDPFVSRKPIRFAPGADGGVRLFVDPGGTPVIAGAEIEGSAALTLEEISQGVPLELAERVVLVLHRVDRKIEDAAEPLGMVGASAGIRRVRMAIERVVDLAVPVLIRGETGTGKELVARAIHDNGPRRGGPFVCVNLGAIPRELAAATLFGSTRGAYTGAIRDRDGLFRAAHGGTLFLDEMGEAPPEVQVALLRALETGEIHPVGAEKPVAVQVRLIAATDADLEDQIQRGQFKAPLLHRLAGYEVRLPPLRERREDIGPLFYHFAREELEAIGEADRLAPQDPYAKPWLPAPIAAQLIRHPWPGNIRQLRNLTRQLVIGSRGLPQLRLDARVADELAPRRASTSSDAIPLRVPSEPGTGPVAARASSEPGTGPVAARASSEPGIEPRRKPSELTETELREALRACDWDLKATADRLRIPRPSIYDLIARYPDIRTAGDLGGDEIIACFRACDGDVDAMVARLEVSKRALTRRLHELGLISRPRSPTR
jgi:two-component system nitrogen regulation response regulator GlnG